MAKPDDILDLIADYLEANDVDNVKTGVQPDDPADCIALLGLQGMNISTARDVPGLQFPRFQALIRNESYDTGSATMQTLRDLLHGEVHLILPVGVNIETTPYVRILRMHAEQDGGPIGTDAQGRYEFSINFNIEYHRVDT